MVSEAVSDALARGSLRLRLQLFRRSHLVVLLSEWLAHSVVRLELQVRLPEIVAAELDSRASSLEHRNASLHAGFIFEL